MVIIYSLKDPNTLEIRYVGKTTSELKTRFDSHCCNQNIYRKNYSAQWIKSLILQNKKPIIEIIEIVEDNIWQEKEKYWIKKFKQEGFKLTNMTEGGDVGCKGYKHTEKAKLNISIKNKRLKSKEWMEKVRINMTKTVATPIVQYDLEMNFIKNWDSICFAADFLIDPTRSKVKNIQACCKGKRNSAYGYKWKYKKDIELLDKEPIG
jgi:ribonuclease BN (tRNA processing enzyme)